MCFEIKDPPARRRILFNRESQSQTSTRRLRHVFSSEIVSVAKTISSVGLFQLPTRMRVLRVISSEKNLEQTGIFKLVPESPYQGSSF